MNRRRLAWVLVLGCILASSAVGQWLDTLIYFPDTLGHVRAPLQVLSNPVTGRSYVLSSDGLLVADPATHERILWHAGGYDHALFCASAGKIYLSSYDYSALGVFDAAADTLLHDIDISDLGAPFGLACSETSEKLYVVLEPADTGGVAVLDVRADTLLGFVAQDVVMSVLWDSEHDRLFVATDAAPDTLLVYDCSNDSLEATVAVSAGSPTGMALDPATDKLYCVAYNGLLSVVSTDQLLETDTLALPRWAAEVALNPVAGRLYAWMTGDSALCMIDATEDSVRSVLQLPGVLVGVEVNPSDGRAYVAISGASDSAAIGVVGAGDTVSRWLYESHDVVSALGFSVARGELYAGLVSDYINIYDAGPDTLAGRVEASWSPVGGLVANPVTRKLYVLFREDDEVRVFDSTYSMVARIPFPLSARTTFPVFDAARNRIYIVDDGMLWVIDCAGDSLVSQHELPGWTEGLAALSQEAGKLYICPETSTDSAVLVYDCVADSVTKRIPVHSMVSAAAYGPGGSAGSIYVATEVAPVLSVIDVAADSLVDSLAAGATSQDGRLLANPANGRLYFYNDRNNYLYTFDAASRVLVESLRLRVDPDTIVWNRHYDRLYLSRRNAGGVTYVFDCATGTIVDSLLFGMRYALCMNQLNSKLYFGGTSSAVVVDCRTDSVVAVLGETGGFRYAAWDSALNRVYMASYSRNDLSAFADGFPGIVEVRDVPLCQLQLMGNPVRGSASFRCTVPAGEKARLVVSDVLGRQVAAMDMLGSREAVNLMWPGTDTRGRRIAAGVYFAQLAAGSNRATVKVVLE